MHTTRSVPWFGAVLGEGDELVRITTSEGGTDRMGYVAGLVAVRHRGGAYCVRYRFEGSDDHLCQSYDELPAPVAGYVVATLERGMRRGRAFGTYMDVEKGLAALESLAASFSRS